MDLRFLTRSYIMIPVAYLGFLATSMLASYAGCWSIRSGCCFCWIPLVRSRCSACWPCNAWAVTFILGVLSAIVGLLCFPAIIAYKIRGFVTHEKMLDPKTHENADRLIFSYLGEDYCDWCPNERVFAGECMCDNFDALWFLYLVPTGLRVTQAGMFLSFFFMALSRELHYRPRVHPADRLGFHAHVDDRSTASAPQLVAPTNDKELFECCADEHSLWSKLFGCRIFPHDDDGTNPFHADYSGNGGRAVMPSSPITVEGKEDSTDTTEQRFANPVAEADFDDDDGDKVGDDDDSELGSSPISSEAATFEADRE